MALVLDGKYPPTREGRRAFYSNRALRLYPTYLLCLAVSLLVALATQAHGGYYRGFFRRYTLLDPVSAVGVVLSQLLIVGQDLLLFTGIVPGSGLSFTTAFRSDPPSLQAWRLALVPTAWSLSLEVAFYALAPYLTRLRTSYLALAAAGAFLARLAGFWLLGLREDPWTYRFFPFEIGTFLIGMIAYRVYRDHRGLVEGAAGKRWVPWLLVPALVALVRLPGAVLWSPIALLVLLPALFESVKSDAFDRRIGEASYPLYLVHYPILAWVEAYKVPEPMVVVVTVSLALSVAIARWIDHPVDKVRQRLAGTLSGRRSATPPLTWRAGTQATPPELEEGRFPLAKRAASASLTGPEGPVRRFPKNTVFFSVVLFQPAPAPKGR